MSFNFKQAAQESTLLSKIMSNRTKLETEEILDQPLTVIGFDFAPKFDQQGNPVVNDNGEIDTFAVVIFKELPERYYCCGTVFSKVCHNWAEGFSGDADAASSALEKAGGVLVRFSTGKTKKGQNLTTVEIL